MKCDLCLLDLPPGAAHFSPENCVEALKATIELLGKCRECGEPAAPLHPKCVVKAAGRQGSSILVDMGEKKALDVLMGLFSGRKEPDEDDPPKTKGRRWKP